MEPTELTADISCEQKVQNNHASKARALTREGWRRGSRLTSTGWNSYAGRFRTFTR